MIRIYMFLILLSIDFFDVYALQAISVEKVSITVSDLDKPVPFYENLLQFKNVNRYSLSGDSFRELFGITNKRTSANCVVLQLGQEKIELIEFIDEERQQRIPEESRSNDLWFQHIAIVVSDMEKAYEKLLKYGVEHVSTRPQTLPEYIQAAAGIKAFYFRDPDGHNLEIISFPKNKGNPKWQKNTDKIFLGIDHTAIGIEKTSTSLPFYTDIIELTLAGSSNNYGYEQEHLNQVFGANLLISGLGAKSGIGVELLDYIAPPGGRKYPKDSRVTDLWHWHTTISIVDLISVYEELIENGYPLISDNIVETDQDIKAMFRDTDGHAILLTQVKHERFQPKSP